MKMKPGAMQEAQHMRANVAAASRTTPAAKAANERNLRAAKAANAPAPAAPAKAPPKGSLNPIKQRMQQGRSIRQNFMAGGGMMKGYAKGGMANCGASMKPNGAARGK